MSPEQFNGAVLAWYDQHGRKDLPWQQGITPYRVWVSEIMLQQTQVSTVLGYFDRFMAALPSVQALAAAAEDEVLHLWTGLGYYTRARNLHKAAKIVVAQHGGEFPRSVEAAGRAARHRPLHRRRHRQHQHGPARADPRRQRQARAGPLPGPGGLSRRDPRWPRSCGNWPSSLTPHERVNHYTQAMMDLGATLCTRSKPSCLLCPLREGCRAHRLGRETDYPQPKPRKTLPQKRTLMPLLHNGEGAILLYRRPSSGLWGGLWSLPELDEPRSPRRTGQRQHALRLGEPRRSWLG